MTSAGWTQDILTGHGARWLTTSDVRIVVVGAGGWLGLASLDLLSRLLGADFPARVEAFGSQARTLDLGQGRSMRQRPLSDLPRLAPRPTVVLHMAYLTQEKAMAMSEADYVAANRAISARVLEALDPIGATGIFVPSSGAVYKVDDVDASASMRLYGRLKLEDEAAFGAWAGEGPRRAAIARVFNLSGPFINKQSSYALACFVADALAGRPVEVRARRPVWRSYVAISELMSVVFGVLGDGLSGPVVFDTAGDRDYEMGEIAGAVVEALGGELGVIRPGLETDRPDRYLGDGERYRGLCRRHGVQTRDFRAQIITTARFMRTSLLAEDVAGGSGSLTL